MTARTRGLLLIVPAAIVWLLTAVRPTIRLLAASFTTEAGAFGGHGFTTANYRSARFGDAVGTALSLVPVPLLIFVAVGLAIGVTGLSAGVRTRLAGRVLTVLPAACFVPAAAAAAWGEGAGHRPGPWLLVLVGSFGVTVAVAATTYLAAVRGGRRAVIVVTGFAALAGVAVALQQFATPYLTVDPDSGYTASPVVRAFAGVHTFQFGIMTADLVMVSAIVAVLGVSAVVLLIATGTRVAVGPAGRLGRSAGADAPAARPAWVYLGVVAVVLAVAVVLLTPWLSRLGGPVAPHEGVRVLSTTWLKPVSTTLVAVLVAVPAGFGIGALRPFGARSEWLLLPFAPWLFVGVAPYAIAAALPGLVAPDRAGITSLTPPVWLSVPALVLFTLLFRGQAAAYQQAMAAGTSAGRAFVAAYVRPLWPAVLLTGGVLWVTQANDVFWPALTQVVNGMDDTAQSTNLFLYEVTRDVGLDGTAVLTPVPAVLLVLVALVAAQFYLDRLSVVTEPRRQARRGTLSSSRRV